MTIGQAIRYHRMKNRMTQARLGEMIGVTPAAISKWETGAGLPDITMAVPLARALGTTTDELLRFGERYGEFEKRWHQTLRTRGDDPAAQLEVSLDALREFPFDRAFRYRAAVDEQRLGEGAADAGTRMEYLGRAAAHAQLLVELDPENGIGKELLASIVERMK